MKVEVWNDDEGTSVITEGDPNKDKILGHNPYLVRTIEGKDWEDCMFQHHRLMGWEEYKPFDKE